MHVSSTKKVEKLQAGDDSRAFWRLNNVLERCSAPLSARHLKAPRVSGVQVQHEPMFSPRQGTVESHLLHMCQHVTRANRDGLDSPSEKKKRPRNSGRQRLGRGGGSAAVCKNEPASFLLGYQLCSRISVWNVVDPARGVGKVSWQIRRRIIVDNEDARYRHINVSLSAASQVLSCPGVPAIHPSRCIRPAYPVVL
ncbi:hypothetical protein BCR34DRAFT_50745 [Clohesyomyces aquaticus]|uniref:Uncharacterized protein n=1 Tax=Clohesyomyces aquaticus TaxID=1231657 RepID=A0A1Y2A428_9PLEO|nr:hypothetical protein BCR34DRAFT_50745 [Clohesyomyces aquaticus]